MNEINEALGKRSAKAKKGLKVVIDVGVVGEENRQAALVQQLSEVVLKYKAKLTAPGHAEDLQKLLKASGAAKEAA